MPTVGAIRGSLDEELAAKMACPTNPLLVVLQIEIRPGSTRSNCKDGLLFRRIWIHHDRFPLVLGGLVTLERVAGTFLALLVLAIAAKLVCSESGLAAVACTVNPQADLLLDSLSIALRRSSPFVRTQSQPIFGEQRSSFLFLDCAAFGGSLREPGVQVLDGLRDRCWNSRSSGESFGCLFLWLGSSTIEGSDKATTKSESTNTYVVVCSGIVSAGGADCSPEGAPSTPEMEPLFELPLRKTLLALLMKREKPGGLSPEPPAPPVVGELIVGDRRLPNCDDLTKMI